MYGDVFVKLKGVVIFVEFGVFDGFLMKVMVIGVCLFEVFGVVSGLFVDVLVERIRVCFGVEEVCVFRFIKCFDL